MAKTVKFNLICDGAPIRTVEDLRDNFSIEDVLAYYDSKLLHRWLSVRGYDDLLNKVEEIKSEDPVEIIKLLISLFEVELDEKKVEESVYILQYKKEREALVSIYNEKNTKANDVVADYFAGYRQLVEQIVDHADDIAVIRAAVTEMIDNYSWILEIDHRNLFYTLYYKAAMALFVMLSHEETRKFYLPQVVFATEKSDDGTKEIVETTTDIAKKYDDPEMQKLMSIKNSLYTSIRKIIPVAETILGDNLHSFAGVTDGYWKDIEAKGKKYMIISMEPGNYVRSAGKAGEELSCSDVQNHFIILDGIDYKSNNAAHKLL